MEEKKADIDILEELIRDYKDEKEFVGEEIIKAMETLIEENKGLKENELDYTSIYLDGVYDERNKWQKKIKEEIEEVKDGTFDAKIVLQSLLEKE